MRNSTLKITQFVVLLFITQCYFGILKAQVPNLGSANNYCILSGDSINVTHIINTKGYVGAINTVTGNLIYNGQNAVGSSGNTINAMASLNNLINDFNQRTFISLSNLDSGTYLPGVYKMTGNLELNFHVTFNGDSDDYFIIIIDWKFRSS